MVLGSLALPPLGLAILMPPLIPELWPLQLLLSFVGVATPLVLAARWLWRRHATRGWRRAVATLVVLASLVALPTWAIAAFWLDPDNGIVTSRRLAAMITAPAGRWYVYQMSGIPDGWDGAQIMERRWLWREPVWNSSSEPFATEIFDGRLVRLGRHRVRLGHRDGRLAAWVDGRSARVWETWRNGRGL